jgi:hypothetical protein
MIYGVVADVMVVLNRDDDGPPVEYSAHPATWRSPSSLREFFDAELVTEVEPEAARIEILGGQSTGRRCPMSSMLATAPERGRDGSGARGDGPRD